MNKLTGKVAVVTGASKGIGASIAEHLAAEGASVVVNYANSKAGAEAIVRRIKEKGGKALAVGPKRHGPEAFQRGACLLAEPGVPDLGALAVAGRHDPAAVRAERHAVDRAAGALPQTTVIRAAPPPV